MNFIRKWVDFISSIVQEGGIHVGSQNVYKNTRCKKVVRKACIGDVFRDDKT